MGAFEEMKIITACVKKIIQAADDAKIALDDGNVVDLCEDQLKTTYLNQVRSLGRISLSTIRFAISEAGFAERFPKAISK